MSDRVTPVRHVIFILLYWTSDKKLTVLTFKSASLIVEKRLLAILPAILSSVYNVIDCVIKWLEIDCVNQCTFIFVIKI